MEDQDPIKPSFKSGVLAKALLWAFVAAVLYAVVIYLIFNGNTTGATVTVSYSFLALMPMGVGAITVYISWREKPLSVLQWVLRPWVPITAFAALSVPFFREGSICIAMALPLFLGAASLGGVSMGLVLRRRWAKRQLLSCMLFLPLAFSALEPNYCPDAAPRTVRSSLQIRATAPEIWRQVTDVRRIEPGELPASFTHFIGVPKPLEARMSGPGAGALRTSRWEKGVEFAERIRVWNPPHSFEYRFEIDPEKIPKDALDEHVELGGKFLDVLDGGYEIEELPHGACSVTLSTRYRNSSATQVYGNLWADFILDDFHRSLLKMIKARCEKT